MKHYFLFLLLPFLALGQVTIKINYAHHLTPLNDDLYLAGDFNAWSENNAAYKFQRTGFNKFEITITPTVGVSNYKITRGTWPSVEADANGNFLANRSFNYTGASLTQTLQINGWEDIGGINLTDAASNVHILDNQFYMPQLNRTRRVWIYLPPDYHTSNKTYPVLYMHDGQNLFDSYFTSFGEWEVDESMNTLFYQGDYGAIVIGVDNGGSERLNEYSPWFNPSYGGGLGDEYTDFLVYTLKPYIDNHFRTIPQPEYTATLGSSMGGLIAQYGAIEYQNTFKKAGVFSPAFWFSSNIFNQVAIKNVQSDMKFYFVSGTNESSSMVPLIQRMKDSLISNGLNTSRINMLTHADGQHSEWYWAREFPAAYIWLFSGLSYPTPTSIVSKEHSNELSIYPNPATDKLNIHIDNVNSTGEWTVELQTINGQILYHQTMIDNSSINTTALVNGVYVIHAHNKHGERLSKKIIVQH